MLPAEIADQELARMVKENQSNEAMTEIIARHTGIYLSVVNSFNIPPLQKNDLLDSKNTNIYKYTLRYDEDKMKLSSYLWQSTYFDCLKTLEKTVETEEVTDNQFSESFGYNDEESVKNTTLQIARNVGGRDFEKVVEARHFGNGTAKLSWHLMPQKIGKSHEWARGVYLQNLEKFKIEMKNKFNYVNL
jgi:hypothetical protein